MLVEIGKNHVFRFIDVRELVDEARIRRSDRGCSADGRLVVACVIARLSQRLDDQRRHIRLADIRVRSCNKSPLLISCSFFR